MNAGVAKTFPNEHWSRKTCDLKTSCLKFTCFEVLLCAWIMEFFEIPRQINLCINQRPKVSTLVKFLKTLEHSSHCWNAMVCHASLRGADMGSKKGLCESLLMNGIAVFQNLLRTCTFRCLLDWIKNLGEEYRCIISLQPSRSQQYHTTNSTKIFSAVKDLNNAYGFKEYSSLSGQRMFEVLNSCLRSKQ